MRAAMMLRRGRRAAPTLVALAASAVLARFVVGAILARAGRPAVPLDDAFIHFQYARRIAEGAPLRYTGDAISTGATSLVWPALLAPFYALGARGLSLVWVAWALGTIALAGLAVDTGRLAKRLTNTAGGIAAGAMCLAFGPFAWFAWSGMETIPFAWILVRTARLAAEALDGEDARAGRAPPIAQLAALGFLAPLVRPEGALASAFAAIAIARRATGPRRALAALPVLGCAALPALFFALNGDPTGATARVKWLVYNPYYDAGRLLAQIGEHARLLAFDVLDGGDWTWVFVPRGLILVIFFGALCLGRAWRRAPWAAAVTIAIAAGALATCSYQTFLWNRVRYVWPFVPAGFVLCACFAHEVGLLLRRLRAPLEMASAAIGAALVARMIALLPSATADLAQSAAAVDDQQVKLGEWVNAELPAEAIVGVNDTGAIAYMGQRRTFDIVGLTTEGEGAAWVAGAGSRYERFEHMRSEELPTHFILYPEWFGVDAVLGRELTRRTVIDHAILGGDTMVAYEADFASLGSGARPAEAPRGEAPADELDVADLESESAHGFELGDAWDTDDVARDGEGLDGREIVDGGRLARARDSFWMEMPKWGAPLLVMRLSAEQPTKVRVSAAGQEIVTVDVPPRPWIEARIPLPPTSAERTRIEVVALDEHGLPVPPRSRSRERRFESFHYWVYAR